MNRNPKTPHEKFDLSTFMVIANYTPAMSFMPGFILMTTGYWVPSAVVASLFIAMLRTPPYLQAFLKQHMWYRVLLAGLFGGSLFFGVSVAYLGFARLPTTFVWGVLTVPVWLVSLVVLQTRHYDSRL